MTIFHIIIGTSEKAFLVPEKVDPGLPMLSVLCHLEPSMAFPPALLPVQLFPQPSNPRSLPKNHPQLPFGSLNLHPLNQLLFPIAKSFKKETLRKRE